MAVVVGVEGAEHEAVVGGVQTWQRAERGREVLAHEAVHGSEGVELVVGGEERGVAAKDGLGTEGGAGVERGTGHRVERGIAHHVERGITHRIQRGITHRVQRRSRISRRRRSEEIILHDILEIGQREIISSRNYHETHTHTTYKAPWCSHHSQIHFRGNGVRIDGHPRCRCWKMARVNCSAATGKSRDNCARASTSKQREEAKPIRSTSLHRQTDRH